MKQIDAAIALKILVATAPSGTADPTLKAMRFIEEAARLGRLQVRAFRGHATDQRETVPAVEVADLAFDFMARPSKENDQLPVGEADLVTAGWGTLCPDGSQEGEPQTVWRNVRFLLREIEGAKADFVAWLEGRHIEPEAPAGQRQRSRRAPKGEAIKKVLARLYPNGVPDETDLPNKALCRAVAKELSFNVNDRTICRIRKLMTGDLTSATCRRCRVH